MRFFDWFRPKPAPRIEVEDLYPMDVVGESHYQRALERLAGGKKEESASVWLTADLIPEPRNPADPNAVTVVIAGELVGYLSREHAAAFRRMSLGKMTGVIAEIRGGWRRSQPRTPDDDGPMEGSFGVRLYLEDDEVGWGLDGYAER